MNSMWVYRHVYKMAAIPIDFDLFTPAHSIHNSHHHVWRTLCRKIIVYTDNVLLIMISRLMWFIWNYDWESIIKSALYHVWFFYRRDWKSFSTVCISKPEATVDALQQYSIVIPRGETLNRSSCCYVFAVLLLWSAVLCTECSKSSSNEKPPKRDLLQLYAREFYVR